jgi:hypothetical protein
MALVYTRVSSEEQERDGLSLPSQLMDCRQYAKRGKSFTTWACSLGEHCQRKPEWTFYEQGLLAALPHPWVLPRIRSATLMSP